MILASGEIGYLVYSAAPLLEKIREKDQLELYIHTRVREDDISLYGFETFAELEFFRTLMGVNGIGPKLALEILALNPEKVKFAITQGDILFLSKISGIGKKTAERMIVELKNKIDFTDFSNLRGSLQISENINAIAALENLGYQKFEITRVLKSMPDNIIETTNIITYFLQNV